MYHYLKERLNTMQNKRKILKQYLLQQAKIIRLNEMLSRNPENEHIYYKQINDCIKLRQHIEDRINLVDDDILKELLIQKYMCGKTLEEISYSINYSKRHTERLHIKALNAINI